MRAGINTNIFQGHSVRTTSASTAKIKGAPIGNILRAGGWSTEKTFAKYYDKPLLDLQTVSDILLEKQLYSNTV